jgi:hypothetical protein
MNNYQLYNSDNIHFICYSYHNDDNYNLYYNDDIYNMSHIYNVSHIDDIYQKNYTDVKILIFFDNFNDSIHKIGCMPNIIFINFGCSFNHPIKWISKLPKLKSIVLGSSFNLCNYSLKVLNNLQNLQNVFFLNDYCLYDHTYLQNKLYGYNYFKNYNNNFNNSNNLNKLKIFTFKDYRKTHSIINNLYMLCDKILYSYNKLILHLYLDIFKIIFTQHTSFIKLINKKSNIQFININLINNIHSDYYLKIKLNLNIYYKMKLTINIYKSQTILYKYLKLPY